METYFPPIDSPFSGKRVLHKQVESEPPKGGEFFSYYSDIEPKWLSTAINKVRSLSRLPRNWDGYYSEPIPIEAINEAIEIIKGIDLEPGIFPTGLKSVQLEYYSNNNDYLEIEVYGPNRIEILSLKSDGIEQLSTTIEDRQDLIPIIQMHFS